MEANGKKRLLFIINTPSQAHTWRHVLKGLKADGHEVRILAREYGSTPELIKSFGLEYSTFKPMGSQVGRLLAVLGHFEECYRLSRDFAPTMVIGFGLDAAVTAMLFRKPCLAFFDDEHTFVQNRITSLLASCAVTPDTFEKTLGRKHLRLRGYKELAYLHPRYFVPDPAIHEELGIGRDEPFVILRFNLMDAIHDIGMHSIFPDADQVALVRNFEKHARVFISPEGPLSKELEGYRLRIRYDRIHHALHFARLLVSDSCTMTTEAAILGTPAVRIHPIVGRQKDPRIYGELEHKYGMIYSFQEPGKAIGKAIELIARPNIKAEWEQKRKILLADKVDVTKFMLDFIEHWSGERVRAGLVTNAPVAN